MTRREFASLLAGAGAILTGGRTAGAKPTAAAEAQGGAQTSGQANGAIAGYRNPKLPIEQRTADLLGRMTLEEKVEQLRGGRTSIYGILDTTGKFTDRDISTNWRKMYDMHSQRSPHDQDVYRNALQRYAVEKTRLGIPQIFQDEALHGYTTNDATSFPQATALGSTWDPELIQRAFTAVGGRGCLRGHQSGFRACP